MFYDLQQDRGMNELTHFQSEFFKEKAYNNKAHQFSIPICLNFNLSLV